LHDNIINKRFFNKLQVVFSFRYLQLELIKLWSWAPEGQILPELGTRLTDLPTKIRFRKINYWKQVKLDFSRKLSGCRRPAAVFWLFLAKIL